MWFDKWLENITSKRNYELTVLFISLDIWLAYLILHSLIRIKIPMENRIFFKNTLVSFTFKKKWIDLLLMIFSNFAMTKNEAYCLF